MIPFDNFDWFKRFFGRNYNYNNSNPMRRGATPSFFDFDPFREYDKAEREINHMFEQLDYISKNSPKELVREYEKEDGSKVREVGPLVYGYSMTIGPDGKPIVHEFGNIKHPTQNNNRSGMDTGLTAAPQITAEREPLVDVGITDKEVKVVLEMPGVKKDDIKINAFDKTLEVITNDKQRKYHKNIELPYETDVDTAKSTYNNGILEITFNKKKKEAKPKGKEIKIDYQSYQKI
mgnify:CR=1 FL=1